MSQSSILLLFTGLGALWKETFSFSFVAPMSSMMFSLRTVLCAVPPSYTAVFQIATRLAPFFCLFGCWLKHKNFISWLFGIVLLLYTWCLTLFFYSVPAHASWKKKKKKLKYQFWNEHFQGERENETNKPLFSCYNTISERLRKAWLICTSFLLHPVSLSSMEILYELGVSLVNIDVGVVSLMREP